MKNRSYMLLMILFLVFIFSTTAANAIKYIYEGNKFTDVRGPWTTDDSVRMILELEQALPPNYYYTEGSEPKGWIFATDGVQSANMRAPGGVLESWINLWTDPNADIVKWDIRLVTEGPLGTIGADLIQTQKDYFGNTGDIGAFVNRDDGHVYGRNRNNPGKWTVVPEPATIFLLGCGLVGLTISKRKSKK